MHKYQEEASYVKRALAKDRDRFLRNLAMLNKTDMVFADPAKGLVSAITFANGGQTRPHKRSVEIFYLAALNTLGADEPAGEAWRRASPPQISVKVIETQLEVIREKYGEKEAQYVAPFAAWLADQVATGWLPEDLLRPMEHMIVGRRGSGIVGERGPLVSEDYDMHDAIRRIQEFAVVS